MHPKRLAAGLAFALTMAVCAAIRNGEAEMIGTRRVHHEVSAIKR